MTFGARFQMSTVLTPLFDPGITVEDIVAIGGPPKSQTDCGEFTVLYYGPDGLDLTSIQESAGSQQ